MLQGIVEGVTYEMKALAGQLEAISEVPIEVIRSFGGPTKSSKWLQLKADISGKKVEAVQIEEASALGAAILAGVATGVYSSYEQAIKAAVKIKAAYQPRPVIRKKYEHHYAIYKQLVEALKPVNKRLYYI
jgi:xylulokinase